ncbi:hypothetical protein JMN32_15160 [Fulvivirga sp. 29W222]|uniref:Lipocalin-like domain-containing protein n=1 Tax=Fulvivirga marina TaxID=2494733 RepID=A0A937FWW2_9BACT|nr:hypothetical protein [Fulvivirga marina]MBL6447655.1 hypothetical protein [Fulvivirga marina]
MKINNLIFYVALLVGVSLGLASCSEDDEPEVLIDPSVLIGTWNAVSQQYKDCPDAANNATNTCGTQDFCFIISFNEDGTYTEQQFGSATVDDGNYNAMEGILSGCFTYKGCQNWIFSVSGDKLTLQQVNSTECSEVLTFTKGS